MTRKGLHRHDLKSKSMQRFRTAEVRQAIWCPRCRLLRWHTGGKCETCKERKHDTT